MRTDGGHDAAILSVDGELTGFAFDGSGDLWLSILTPGGGSLCRAAHDSWGTAVEQVEMCIRDRRSATLKVTSGVISRGAKPVPPVVRIRFT